MTVCDKIAVNVSTKQQEQRSVHLYPSFSFYKYYRKRCSLREFIQTFLIFHQINSLNRLDLDTISF